MTLDDNSSVYVGGLAYDSTEDMLQKAFETYGDINSIKIVYDRESGQSRGFGFVTFTNPRSAVKAIHGLDGGVIGGRTIRVNEVKKNSGKSQNRDGSFRDRGDKNRDHRERRGRNFSPQRNRRSSPVQRRSARGRSPMLSPVRGCSTRNLSPSYRRSRSPRAAQSTSFNSSSGERPRAHSSASPSPQSSNRSPQKRDEGAHRSKRDQQSSRTAKDKHADVVKVREELDRALQSRQELEDKVTSLTSAVDQAKETVSALQSNTQKLEESLANALASAAHRHHQLRKLQKGILQVKDSSERLKIHEKELKILMAATMAELDVMDMDTELHGGHYEADKTVEIGGLK